MKVALSTRVLPLFLANLSLLQNIFKYYWNTIKQHLNAI